MWWLFLVCERRRRFVGELLEGRKLLDWLCFFVFASSDPDRRGIRVIRQLSAPAEVFQKSQDVEGSPVSKISEAEPRTVYRELQSGVAEAVTQP